jgi:hypothetical protein
MDDRIGVKAGVCAIALDKTRVGKAEVRLVGLVLEETPVLDGTTETRVGGTLESRLGETEGLDLAECVGLGCVRLGLFEADGPG